MLEIVQTSGPVAAFRVRGRLTGDDYDRMAAELERQLKFHEHIAVYGDFSELDGMSVEALIKDARYSVSKLSDLRRFARVAVVSDSPVLRTWVRLVWSIVPHSQLLTFGARERETALTWASSALEHGEPHGLHWIATTRPDTYAFSWNGTVTDADIDTVVKKLEVEFEAHSCVRVLARIEHMGGIQPRALFRSAVLRLKTLGLRKVERYAIVGGPSWLARYGQIGQQLTGIELRWFPQEREPEAWAWLEAQPAAAAQHTSAPGTPPP